MTERTQQNESETSPQPEGLTRLCVEGFKSVRDRTCIDIAPLTILAGANSSGKSSIMQPLLLLKQTLEAPYDPGALLLDGPNVSFTSSQQLLSGTHNGHAQGTFAIGYGSDSKDVDLEFSLSNNWDGFATTSALYTDMGSKIRLFPDDREPDFEATDKRRCSHAVGAIERDNLLKKPPFRQN
jgi:AAA15 family ATPase/GTPase